MGTRRRQIHSLPALGWPRKVVTIEPVLDFDLMEFPQMIKALAPEYVWLGLNSRPKQVPLPEPSSLNLGKLIIDLEYLGMEVRRKDLREDLR